MRLLLATTLVGAGLLGCVAQTGSYTYNRYDYWSFRAGVGHLPEPNYLPFVAHRERLPDGSPGLVFCRWPDEAFPLRYHVELPVIPGDVDDEFNPRAPEDYVAAIHRAFDRWEKVLGRPVRFQFTDDPSQADLRVHLEASRHVEREVEVAGMLRNEGSRCRTLGPGPGLDRMRIEFNVGEVYLFLVDQVGLLTPGQIEGVALHEIGHVLGASGRHSPLRGDLMYEAARDRRGERFSEHDRNTFRALYSLPPGTIYATIGPRAERPTPEARRHPPRLDRPIRDERFGLEVRFPVGWQTIQTPRGWVAVDGLSWDYDASIQVMSLRGDLKSYLARYGAYHMARGELVGSERMELDGEPVVRVVLRSGGRTEETAALDWAADQVLLVVADCRESDYAAYRPWFRHVLLSLQRVDELGSTDVGAGVKPP